MAKRPEFFKGGFYHIYNRGVDKRDITANDIDRARFVYDLFAFNTEYPAVMTTHRFRQFRGPTSKAKEDNERVYKFRGWTSELGGEDKHRAKKKLVDIVAWALMPNHYHFCLRQDTDRPISKFISVIFNAYVQAVNRQQNRAGTLFERRFRHVWVEQEEYLIHLCRYIHLNPVDRKSVV